MVVGDSVRFGGVRSLSAIVLASAMAAMSGPYGLGQQPVDAAPEAVATPVADTAVVVPVADGADGKPVATTVAAKGKKVKKKKEKAPKLTPMNIVQGTLTVDGWTGKARMNYEIADLKYVYLWAPEVGTVVVSNAKFPLATEQPNGFSGNTLTVDANGHTLQLFSDKKLLKEKKPVSAWVYVDTMYKVPSSFPVMGYGATTQAPYAWPGAKNVQLAKSGVAVAPPLPKDLRPSLVASSCVPAGSKAAGTRCPVATTSGGGSVVATQGTPVAQVQ